MLMQLQAAARKGVRLSWRGLRSWPVWGAMLLVASMLYKLNWLDGQLNVGGMNHWKWQVNAGAMLLATCWTALLGPKTRAVALAALDLALSFVIFADLVYFRYFKDFIAVPVLLQAGQVSALEESIWSLIRPQDWLLFADLPVAALLAAAVVLRDRRRRAALRGAPALAGAEPRRRRKRWIGAATAVLLFCAGYLLIAVPVEEQKNGWARGLFVGNWWNVPIYNVTGLFGFHGYDVYRYASENWFGGGLSPEETEAARSWFDDQRRLQRTAESDPLFGAYKGKNVLVVQAEAFHAFVLGASIGGQEITPNLNELMKKSVYFPNFYHQTAQGRTSDADFAVSCSLHPMPSGSVFIRFATHEFDCLPEMLNAEGYDTTVHHAYDGSFWNRFNMYHNMEYDRFYNAKDYTVDEPLGWSLGDKSFFRQTIRQLKERDSEPFYALAITLSSHHPYKMPYREIRLDVGSFEGTIFGDYLHAVHYVDAAVGELVAGLKAEGLWDDTILLFYGDHDNSIYDWKYYDQFYGAPVSALQKDRIAKQVPLLLHLPGDVHAGRSEKAGGQMDIAPTILHLLGIPVGDRYMQGVSLLTDAPKPVVFRNGGFTDGRVYYIPSDDGVAENGSCYSLPDGDLTDFAACAPGVEAAKRELLVSDRVVEHDLISRFRKD